jgi:hypothetical protein
MATIEVVLLSVEKINTKNGERVKAVVETEDRNTLTLWEFPKKQNCLSEVPANTIIKIEPQENNPQYYRWVPTPLAPDVKKRKALDSVENQIKQLIWLHKLIDEKLKEAEINLPPETVAKYVINIQAKLNKES